MDCESRGWVARRDEGAYTKEIWTEEQRRQPAPSPYPAATPSMTAQTCHHIGMIFISTDVKLNTHPE